VKVVPGLRLVADSHADSFRLQSEIALRLPPADVLPKCGGTGRSLGTVCIAPMFLRKALFLEKLIRKWSGNCRFREEAPSEREREQADVTVLNHKTRRTKMTNSIESYPGSGQ